MNADPSASAVRRFVRKRGPALARALPAGELILEFYSEEVINKKEKRLLQAKKNDEKASDAELMELLLDWLDDKSKPELLAFLNIVNANKERLEKVSNAAVSELSALLSAEKPEETRRGSERVPTQINGERLPPQTNGDRSPHQATSERSPSKTNGERSPPRTNGEATVPSGLPHAEHKLPETTPIPGTRTKVRERTIMSIADMITSMQDCRRLAVQLDLAKGSSFVETILSGNHRANGNEVAHQVMVQWAKEKGSSAFGEVLLDALMKMRLTEIADQFYKELTGKELPIRHSHSHKSYGVEPSTDRSSRLPTYTGDPSASFWDELLRPYFSDLRRRLGSSGEVRSKCYEKGLITLEELENLATKTNHYEHNEAFLNILCMNPASNFPLFLDVLQLFGRYRDLVPLLEERYRQFVWQQSRYR